MRINFAAIFAVIWLLLTPAFAFSQPDVLDSILDEVGFTRADLGYRPAGYWNRFPLDVPHRLTSFDALFAEPLKLSDYATVMANTVELYLNPAYADSSQNGLYKLVYNLGVDKKMGGFRAYSANLRPAPEGPQPFLSAVSELYRLDGKPTPYRSFGQAAGPIDTAGIEIEMIRRLPDTVHVLLAELLVNLADAIHWRNLAFRNCSYDDLAEAFTIRDLANTQADGQVYYAELDDIAATIDWPSLFYAALKVSAAAERAERNLLGVVGEIPRDLAFELETPFGRIAVFSAAFSKERYPRMALPQVTTPDGTPTTYDATNTLLVIDFGRPMTYSGTPGTTASLSNPVSVLIDLGGDDQYGQAELLNPPCAGVGLMGVGLVLDHEGNDLYYGSTYAQGAGLFGVGMLVDREGDDSYRAELSAQGCGYFGIGLCFDAVGNDRYYLYGSGQGHGGIGGGIGVCASFAGDDHYTAEPYSEVFNRGDYHSDHKINGNEAQGAGFGRRGDGSDGHAWAGGLGAIIDIHGDDQYHSGNWTLGVGYWFATGIAVDRGGDDLYRSCYFTQGSGAHYCNGILLDEGGNDRHELYETAGAGLGFGWDYTNAFLINKGGNDVYQAKMISMGLAQIRSNAFLIDIGGDDDYRLGEGTPGLGEATYREDYDHPSRLNPYCSYAKSFGGFIDIGGSDSYVSFKGSAESPHPLAKDGSLWLQPSRDDEHFGADNFGAGIDTDEGTIPELSKWD